MKAKTAYMRVSNIYETQINTKSTTKKLSLKHKTFLYQREKQEKFIALKTEVLLLILDPKS